VGGGQANVALLLRKPALAHSASDPTDLLRAALEVNRSTRGTQLLDAPLVAGPFPRGARRAWRANLALAGDAAGFFDGITGEGMSLALATAPACAAAVSRFIDSGSDDGLREYNRVRVRTGRASTLLGQLTLALAYRQRLGRYAVGNLARRPATFEKLVAINGGEIPLRSLTPRDLLALTTGW
jgi:flavin-dependent dehydrogenase